MKNLSIFFYKNSKIIKNIREYLVDEILSGGIVTN